MKKLLFLILISLSMSACQGEKNKCVNLFKKKDHAKAFPVCKAMAEQGNARAQTRLGWMYHNGVGVIQDKQYAFFWYLLAAANGDGEARALRDIIKSQLTKQQQAESKQAVKEVFEAMQK